MGLVLVVHHKTRPSVELECRIALAGRRRHAFARIAVGGVVKVELALVPRDPAPRRGVLDLGEGDKDEVDIVLP